MWVKTRVVTLGRIVGKGCMLDWYGVDVHVSQWKSSASIFGESGESADEEICNLFFSLQFHQVISGVGWEGFRFSFCQ